MTGESQTVEQVKNKKILYTAMTVLMITGSANLITYNYQNETVYKD